MVWSVSLLAALHTVILVLDAPVAPRLAAVEPPVDPMLRLFVAVLPPIWTCGCWVLLSPFSLLRQWVALQEAFAGLPWLALHSRWVRSFLRWLLVTSGRVRSLALWVSQSPEPYERLSGLGVGGESRGVVLGVVALRLLGLYMVVSDQLLLARFLALEAVGALALTKVLATAQHKEPQASFVDPHLLRAIWSTFFQLLVRVLLNQLFYKLPFLSVVAPSVVSALLGMLLPPFLSEAIPRLLPTAFPTALVERELSLQLLRSCECVLRRVARLLVASPVSVPRDFNRTLDLAVRCRSSPGRVLGLLLPLRPLLWPSLALSHCRRGVFLSGSAVICALSRLLVLTLGSV